jgi:restriction endonuclease S subunit
VGVKSGLNFNDIRSLSVLVAPKELQDKFAQIYQKQEEASQRQYATLDCSERLNSSLARNLFTQN